MSISAFTRFLVLPAALGASLAFASGASAQDAQSPSKSPWAVFNLGATAYKNGHKDEAVQAYRDASEQGQIGATWKLGRMYAAGDGVKRDDYQAYQYYSAVITQPIEAGSQDESFVGDAYAELGRLTANGIPGSPVVANPSLAQDYYARAANYNSTIGQFELGRWYLQNAKPTPGNLKLAAMWLKAAARRGHQGARAMLGNMLFQQGKVVEGLAQMTVALERAPDTDRNWIRPLQEEAFAVSDDQAREAAIERADLLLKQK